MLERVVQELADAVLKRRQGCSLGVISQRSLGIDYYLTQLPPFDFTSYIEPSTNAHRYPPSLTLTIYNPFAFALPFAVPSISLTFPFRSPPSSLAFPFAVPFISAALPLASPASSDAVPEVSDVASEVLVLTVWDAASVIVS